jgi:hypothetical protein
VFVIVISLKPTRVEHLTRHQYTGKLLALLANIRLGQKLMALASTRAYCDIVKITFVKSLIDTKFVGLVEILNFTFD